MRWEKVFLSYATKDEKIVEKIAAALERVGLEPFMAQHNPAIGTDLVNKIIQEIKDSNCFVPILTTNSVVSQWVNQEIGYAFSREELGIYPVVEKELQIKGFVNYSKDVIRMDKDNLDDTIYILMAFLREYINRNIDVIEKIHIICQCTNKYEVDLPSQVDIDLAIKEERFIPAICKKCKRQNNLSPKTFEIKESSKLAF